MLAALGVPVGGAEAAKRSKTWTKIALKFDADYGVHFGITNIGKWASTGSKMEGNGCQNGAKVDHTASRGPEAEYAKNVLRMVF